MRDFRLQTKTSTQIQLPARQSFPAALWVGKLGIITGTPHFGKCFNHSALAAFCFLTKVCPRQPISLWYDGKLDEQSRPIIGGNHFPDTAG